MSRSVRYNNVSLEVRNVPLVLRKVTYFPALPATEIDPPEAANVSWDGCLVGGKNIEPLLDTSVQEEIDDALLAYCGAQ